MSKIRTFMILALISGQALALIAGMMLYYQPAASAPANDGVPMVDRATVLGVMIGVLAALWTGIVVRLVLRGCEAGFESVRSALHEEILNKNKDLMATRDAVIFGMARLSESRDANTGQHLVRIQHYVEALARQLRENNPELQELMTDDWIGDLGLSSALHDIGKVSVPDSILLKPGKLTKREFEEIKYHTIVGGDCLKEIERRLGESNFLILAREIAYAHHEWWNGEGYPHGIAGTEIPLSARIVALADVYDALTTDRPYKTAVSHKRVVSMISKRRGSQFEPMIVDAFIAVQDEFDRLRQDLATEESPRVYADAA